MIAVLLAVVGIALLVVGLLLLTVSLYGLLRLSDTYGQLHAQGLATGPGVICVLASSVATLDAATITFCALGIAFTVVTSPVSGHAIARAVHRRQAQPQEPPG